MKASLIPLLFVCVALPTSANQALIECLEARRDLEMILAIESWAKTNKVPIVCGTPRLSASHRVRMACGQEGERFTPQKKLRD
jgi:hypothetical protein